MTAAAALFAAILAVAACTPLSSQVRREAQPLTFAEVQANPEAFKGQMVIWGGVIIETVNRPGASFVKVMKTDLDYQTRPTELSRSEGRFIVRTDRFLDPELFKNGRELTAAGTIAGREVQPIGEIQYVYPVVEARELKLWEQRVDYPPYYYDPWYWGPPYPYRPWGPWGPWGRPYWY